MRLLGQVLRRPQFRENETGLVSELARLGIKELCLFNAAGPCISTVKNREAWFVIALLDAADNKLMLKNMETGEQQLVSVEESIDIIKSNK